jgi:hypothetical protein
MAKISQIIEDDALKDGGKISGRLDFNANEKLRRE